MTIRLHHLAFLAAPVSQSPAIISGRLLGVSFVATPAKFLAPSLPKAQALDVGRWTFHVLAWIEWGFVVVTAVLIAMAWRSARAGIDQLASLVAVIAVVLAVESFALRPLLDGRVLRIIAGESVPPGPWHNLYIALEAFRLVLILASGIHMIWRSEADRAHSSTSLKGRELAA